MKQRRDASGKPGPRTLRQRVNRFMAWIRYKVPQGLRLPLGIVLIFLGFLGFLPVLGFWMIPLGFAIAALGMRPVRQWWRNRRH